MHPNQQHLDNPLSFSQFFLEPVEHVHAQERNQLFLQRNRHGHKKFTTLSRRSLYSTLIWTLRLGSLPQSPPDSVLQSHTIVLIKRPSETSSHTLLASEFALVGQGPGIVVTDDDLLGSVEEVLVSKKGQFVF